jgi:hypothetical protein
MSDETTNYHPSLKNNVIDSETFEQEIDLCRKLSEKNGGFCAWGKCADCGVIPLLVKLHHGILLEKPEEIKKLKDNMFK